MLSEWPRGGCHSKGEIPFRFSSEWPRGGRTKKDSLYNLFRMAKGVPSYRGDSLHSLFRMANEGVAVLRMIPFTISFEWQRGGRHRGIFNDKVAYDDKPRLKGTGRGVPS